MNIKLLFRLSLTFLFLLKLLSSSQERDANVDCSTFISFDCSGHRSFSWKNCNEKHFCSKTFLSNYVASLKSVLKFKRMITNHLRTCIGNNHFPQCHWLYMNPSGILHMILEIINRSSMITLPKLNKLGMEYVKQSQSVIFCLWGERPS